MWCASLCWHIEFNMFNICCGVVLFNLCLWSAFTVMDVFMRRCNTEGAGICSEKECHEKDCIVGGSATGKIEFYVNVFLKKPTQKDLFAEVLVTLNETLCRAKMMLWKRMAMRIEMRQLS